MSESERQQLLVEWNETAVETGSGACVQELFEAQVERTGEAIAVVCGAEEVSYAELNGRANQLAHYLRAQGVAAEVPVGILMERSVAMVVAILGVLKAGGAYVPLDEMYPEERLRFMLADAQVRVLLTKQRQAENMAVAGAQVVRLDGEALEHFDLTGAGCPTAIWPAANRTTMPAETSLTMKTLSVFSVVLLCSVSSVAQVTTADYQRAQSLRQQYDGARPSRDGPRRRR